MGELHLSPLSASAPPVVDCFLSRGLLGRSQRSAAFKRPLRSRDYRRKTSKSCFQPRFPEPLERYLSGSALALSRAVREAFGVVPGIRLPYVLFDNYEGRILPDRPLTRLLRAFNHHSTQATLDDMDRAGAEGVATDDHP